MAARKGAVKPTQVAATTEAADEAPVPGTDTGVLDSLIGTCYRQLITENRANAKLGDLLKMIELRRKLTPSDSSQKEFWQMLELIRSDTLPHKGATNSVNQPQVTKRKAHAA
jgi:hypothetical protein